MIGEKAKELKNIQTKKLGHTKYLIIPYKILFG